MIATGIISQGTTATQNTVFRSTFYSSTYSGFAGHILLATSIIENTNTVSDNCQLNLTNSINALDMIDPLIVFPNPVNRSITISIQTDGNIEIYNQIGELLYSQHYDYSSNENLDISNLKDGIYLIKFQNEKGSIQSQKLIIQKD